MSFKLKHFSATEIEMNEKANKVLLVLPLTPQYIFLSTTLHKRFPI